MLGNRIDRIKKFLNTSKPTKSGEEYARALTSNKRNQKIHKRRMDYLDYDEESPEVVKNKVTINELKLRKSTLIDGVNDSYLESRDAEKLREHVQTTDQEL